MAEVDPVKINNNNIYIIYKKQSVTCLVDVIKTTEYLNDYDYKKMMDDFEANARHQEYLKKIRRKWAAEGKKYDETIQRMKELREETYQKKSKALQQKLKKKEQLLITLQNESNKEKMIEKQKNLEILMKREKTARENVEKFLKEQEEERLKFEEEINQKSKILYNNNYY